MKPFIMLLAVFFTALASFLLIYDSWNFTLSGRIALSAMLLFTAYGHFKFVKGMIMIVPEFIPAKQFVVYATGAMEMAFAITLLIEQTRFWASVGLIIFLIVIFPANINAAFKNVSIAKANFEGRGVSYLWFRIPFQLLLLVWIWIFCL